MNTTIIHKIDEQRNNVAMQRCCLLNRGTGILRVTSYEIAAAHVMEHGGSWLAKTREEYHTSAKNCSNILGQPVPAGGTFLFFDITAYLQGRTFDDILLACIQHKLLLAPGSAFGKGYENYIRVCFTSAKPDVVVQGMNILSGILHPGT